jgi:hypothetical protein
MAVGAKKDAFLRLRTERFIRARDSTGSESKLLRRAIEVMELEANRLIESADCTCPAELRDEATAGIAPPTLDSFDAAPEAAVIATAP